MRTTMAMIMKNIGHDRDKTSIAPTTKADMMVRKMMTAAEQAIIEGDKAQPNKPELQA